MINGITCCLQIENYNYHSVRSTKIHLVLFISVMSDLKVSSPVIDILKKRVYIGGLSKNVNEQDLESRFSSFGVVSKVDIIRQSTGEII